MDKRIYPPKPHFIVGYTGHCPKYRYIQMEQGTPHQLCLNQCHNIINNDAKLANVNIEDHKLTFKEIDLVMAHERDPNYVLPSAPNPQSFLTILNKKLGPKASCDFAPTVAIYQQKMKQESLEKMLAKRIEKKGQPGQRPIFKTKDDFKQFKAVEEDDDNREEVPKEQAVSPQQKLIKSTKKIFNIYRNDSGLTPRYAGHVPGSSFRFGRTFGHDSFNAKKWLKKSYMNVN